MWGCLLLWPPVLGLGPVGSTQTPSVYDELVSTGGASATAPPLPVHPLSFPGQVCANDSDTLELPDSSRALLLGWVPTRLVPALYGLVLAIRLPVNALALWVLATKMPWLPYTVLLMNLAATDLLLALALPPWVTYHLWDQHWPFGEAACHLNTATPYGHMYGSVLLLAAVNLDRYLALVHPLQAHALALPLALQQQTFRLSYSGHKLCHDALPLDAQASHWQPAFTRLPLLAMLLCDRATLRTLSAARQRYGPARKLAAPALASALAFFAPSNVLLLPCYSKPSPDAWGNLYGAYVPSLALSPLNSCVNPFVYYYVSAEFRDKVWARLCRRPLGGTWPPRPPGRGGSCNTGTHSSSLL
ncbi:proteinase-activated receptor 4 [Lemur catta]|uniref:proteinase-activated receptor 4 n=1 Tax=Lemur catta TaxID=9447 RepID=UPI001E26AECA|nr:proteinase-activated receptor 4 [Lemur catta]